MEYIIDDKGKMLNFVINKKYTVYFHFSQTLHQFSKIYMIAFSLDKEKLAIMFFINIYFCVIIAGCGNVGFDEWSCFYDF